MDNFESNVERKRNNKSYVIIIVVLLLIVLGLTCFVLYDKVFTKNETNNSNNTNIIDNKVKNTTTNSITNEIIDNTTTDNKQNNFNISQEQTDYLFDLFTGNSLAYISLNIMDSKKSIISLNDLSNDEMLGILNHSLSSSDRKILNTNGGKSEFGQYEVLVGTFNSNSLKYFSKKITLPNTYNDFGATCKLNSAGDRYICDKFPTGWIAQPQWEYYLTSYKVNNNKLVINGVAVYNDISAYYTDEDKKTEYYCNITNHPDDLEECIRKDSLQLTKIALTFNLGNDSYVFDNIKVVK